MAGPPTDAGPPGGLPEQAADRARSAVEDVFSGSVSNVESIETTPDGERVRAELDGVFESVLIDDPDSDTVAISTANGENYLMHIQIREL
jgi:adenine C2-methylase RlmN of 23S rRNA A2503 and tRNA A37